MPCALVTMGPPFKFSQVKTIAMAVQLSLWEGVGTVLDQNNWRIFCQKKFTDLEEIPNVTTEMWIPNFY